LLWLICCISVGLAQTSLPHSTAAEARESITTLIQARRFAEARSLAEFSLSQWQNDAAFPHLLGLVMFQTGQVERAEQYMQSALKLAPKDNELLYDLGLVHLAMRRYENAANEFQTLIQRQPANATNHILLGRALLNSNRSVGAIREFRTALRLDPNIPLGHYHLGFAMGSLGKLHEAIGELKLELRREPNNPAVLSQLGHYLLESGEISSAIDSLQQAVSAGATDAYYDLGKARLQNRDTKGSIEALEQAASLAPAANVFFQLSRAYRKTGDQQRAQEAMQRYQALRAKEESTGGMATARIR
jgi:predicted Zn-dependent protease